jgi:hypothetical protein
MGKKGHDLPKNLRQELIVSILEHFSGTSGISTSEILEILDNKCPGVNRRTLYRDLSELSIRFPIYDENEDGKIKWFLRKDSAEINLNNMYRDYLQKELIDLLKRPQEEQLELAV